MEGRTIASDRELLQQQISSCGDPLLLPALVARLLGCHCERLKVDGPVFCAQGKDVSIGTSVYLSAGCELQDYGSITLGDCVVCGPRVKIKAEPERPVSIGHRVWLGEGVEVEPGSHIGDDAVVCAGTRIEGEVAARTIIGGNPPQRFTHPEMTPLRQEQIMPPSVFHVTHWKSGSQWVRGVLEEVAPERIVPQRPAQEHLFQEPLVPGGIYTPIYASEDQFRRAVPATLDQRTFVLVRDPRDTLVSWYYSLRYSHGENFETIPETRRLLAEVDQTDGLAILLRKELYDVITIQMTWLDAGARMFRYEDLLADEMREFRAIMDFCEIEITDQRLREIVAKHSFERVTGRKRGQDDPMAFHRKGQAGDWRNHFPDRLTTYFRTHFGEATVRLGYAPPGRGRW